MISEPNRVSLRRPENLDKIKSAVDPSASGIAGNSVS